MKTAAKKRPAKKAAPSLPETLVSLTEQANQGCNVAARKLARLLDDHPELLNDVVGLTPRSETDWIDRIAGRDALRKEVVRREIQALKDGLLGDRSTPLESLLVDQVAICRLMEHQVTALAGQPTSTAEEQESRWRRSEACQRQLVEAIRALAIVRSAFHADSQQNNK